MALQKLWPEEQWWQLRAVKNSTPAVIPPIVTPRVDDTYLSITKYFVTRQALNLYFAGSAFTVDPNVVLSFRDNGRDMVLHLPTVKGWSPDLLESNVALEKAKRATNTNIIFLLYNEYVNRIYYTPSNITTPLIGTVVVERQFPKNYPDNYVYRNITKTPVRGIFADDVLTNQLEIQISDLGGRPLETVLDDSDNRRPIKDILLDLNGTDDMTSRRQPSFTRGVLVSQEPSRKYNNPIEAVIDNQELLTEMRQHLARGGRIVCEVVEVTIPSKFAYESNYVIIDVEGWAFPNISYHNNNQPYWLAGYINLSVIKIFKQIQADDVYHAIQFTKSEMDPAPGKATKMAVTDVSDIKNFSLALKDAVTLKLLQFSAGKYPMFHLEFKFYPRR